MSFNIALSGLKASSIDLEVTGNNIANASTVGFKRSRVEFGDLYSSSFLGAGSNAVGDGVRVQNVKQLFTQGNISFTDSGLDIAINGEGMYVLNNGGEIRYSRAGQFGVDRDGFLVNNSGMRVQGFQANGDGVVSGVRGDLFIDNSNLSPERTTLVEAEFNLDASEDILARRGTTLVADGASSGAITAGSTNSLPAETWTFTYPDGSTRPINTVSGLSSGAIAAQLTQLDGVSASATTTAALPLANFTPSAGDTLTISGVTFNLTTLAQLSNDVNASSLVGVSAVFNGSDLQIISSQGADLNFTYASSSAGSVRVNGTSTPATAQILSSGNTTATVAGVIDLTLDDGITLATTGNQIISTFTGAPFVVNAFDPDDQNTYNHATSTTIFDSLGNAHVMSQYFVKEPSTGTNPPNLWTMYLQIDGQDVGDPNTALPPPQNTQPTLSQFNLVFNTDGQLNTSLSDTILISNWTPLDAQGNPNGADGPNNVLNGGGLPIPNPPTSSNFEVNVDSTTQYGSAFSVNDLRQDGFTTGRLAGLEVDRSGIIFARYTNGQSEVLGQLAMASFPNVEGLAPVGDTTWVETFESGSPVVGAPGTGALGIIQASSVEESNVDLSSELVNLIIAQRNYQANAKTIETANSITQTIINLR